MVLLADRSSTFTIHTHTQSMSTTLDRLCLLYRTVVDIAPLGTGASTVFPLIEAYMFYFIKSYLIDFTLIELESELIFFSALHK